MIQASQFLLLTNMSFAENCSANVNLISAKK